MPGRMSRLLTNSFKINLWIGACKGTIYACTNAIHQVSDFECFLSRRFDFFSDMRTKRARINRAKEKDPLRWHVASIIDCS
jgi:hypothetical protein